MINKRISQFLRPRLTSVFLTRLIIVALSAYLIFGHLLLPIRLAGGSMEPTYHDGSFTFCFRYKFKLSSPQVGEVVTIRFSGRRNMLLKRIIAVAGDKVAFVDGRLFVNDQFVEEPYLVYESDWNMEPKYVKENFVYVVGDNRSMPINNHKHGMASIHRLMGGPIF